MHVGSYKQFCAIAFPLVLVLMFVLVLDCINWEVDWTLVCNGIAEGVGDGVVGQGLRKAQFPG